MAKRKQYRWVCPQCGVGKLGPKKYASDDARAVCLPCTSEGAAGVKGPVPFVLFTCPTLEKSKEREAAAKEEKRRARKEASDAKKAQKREALRQAAEAKKILRDQERAQFFRGEVDLRVEARRIAKALGRGPLELGWSEKYLWQNKGRHLRGQRYVTRIEIEKGQDLNRSRMLILGCLVGTGTRGTGTKWRERVSEVCNKLYGTKLNAGLKPCVIRTHDSQGRAFRPSCHRMVAEGTEQMRLQSLGPNEFLAELRDASLNKNNSARARLMLHLAPSDDIREVGKQYVSEHF